MGNTVQNPQVRVIGIEGIKRLITLLNGDKLSLSIDAETTGLNTFKDKIVCLQFGTSKSVFILDCRSFYALDDKDREYWKEALSQFFAKVHENIGVNLKFDYKMLYYHFGIKLNNVVDCMLQELVIHGVGMGKAENEGVSVNMEDMGERYGISVKKDLQVWSVGLDKKRRFYRDGSYCFNMIKKGRQVTIWYHGNHTAYREDEKVPTEDTFMCEDDKQWYEAFPSTFIDYCVQDVLVPLGINSLQQEILKEKELVYVANLENTCLPAIAHMELNGVYIDRKKWEHIINIKTVERETLEKELQQELDVYLQRARDRVFTESYKQYEEDKKIIEALEKKLAYTFESKKIRTRSGKAFIVVNDQSLSWAKFKALGLKELDGKNVMTVCPKLDMSSINIGSSKQLLEALGEMGISLNSTDREHLEPYVHTYPLIEKLLRWKDLDHFINAFGVSILSKVEQDGRVHPDYRQLGTATGRMSCSTPNWQQIPAREPQETNVRMCVIAEEGNVLLTADLPNIELRIVADMSKDENMLYSFEMGEDLHSKTARIMFDLAEDIDPKKTELVRGFTYRQVAKVINFGLVYGMSPIKLSKTLGIEKEKAVELFDRYFSAYEGVRRWLDETAYNAKQDGYSMTYAGRKRFYNFMAVGDYDKNTMEWETYIAQRALSFRINGGYERRAKNHPVQGTNADITKHALVLLQKYAPSDMKIIACVHDEIVCEVPKSKAEERAKLLSACMYKACKHYLKVVHVPEIDVEIESYWKKG